MPFPPGYKHSDETKRKISESKMGSKHSDATKRKMSNIHKGRPKPPRSNEHRRKLSESMKGRQLTQKTREKMTESIKGKTWEEMYGKEKSDNMKQKLSVVCKRMNPGQYNVCPSKPQVALYERIKKIYPTAQIEFPVSFGKKNMRLDIAIPELMVNIEYDGSYWHNEINDINRDGILSLIGWKIIRIKDTDTEEIIKNKLKVIQNVKKNN